MKIFMWLILVMVCCHGAYAQKVGSNQNIASTTVPNKSNSDFRYTIISETSEIQRKVNSVGDYKFVLVLIDDSAFNQDNLKTLFVLLDKRYVRRTGLYVDVYTTLDAVPTPEEFDRMDLYGPVRDYQKYKHAYLSRDKRGYLIRFEIPGKVKPQELFLGFALKE